MFTCFVSLNEHVEHQNCLIPLAWQSFLTGLLDLLLYSRSQVWVGFQTGNMVQFSGNIAQFMLPHDETYPLMTLERVLSVVAFFLGSFSGSFGGRYFGTRTRKWLFISSILQSLLLWGAAGICAGMRGDGSLAARHVRPWCCVDVACGVATGV